MHRLATSNLDCFQARVLDLTVCYTIYTSPQLPFCKEDSTLLEEGSLDIVSPCCVETHTAIAC